MKDDFEVIKYKFDDEIRIIPIFDLHYGSIGCNLKEWKNFIEYVLMNEDVYVVLGGDLVDNQTKNSHSPFDATIRPSEQKRWLAEQLKLIKDRILCVTSGNHEKRKDNTASDDDFMYDVCMKLDIEDKYRPNMCFLKVQLGDRNEHNRKTYMIGVTHGSGGGTLTGTGINKNEKFGYTIDGLDVLITGHTHKASITKPSKIVFDSKNDKITMKPFYAITATSWLDYGGYALRQQLNPASHMFQEITLTKQKVKKIEIKVK